MTMYPGAQVGPFTIKNDRRELWVFETLKDAAEFIRYHQLCMVDQPLDQGSVNLPENRGISYSLPVRCILLDECDLIVGIHRIKEVIACLPPRAMPRWFYRYGNYKPERDFRKNPVPCTGKRRWTGFCRHVATTGELRATQGLEADLRDIEDFPIPVKIRRSRKTIPTLWDDVPFARRGDSWKNYRKTRYKPK